MVKIQKYKLLQTHKNKPKKEKAKNLKTTSA